MQNLHAQHTPAARQASYPGHPTPPRRTKNPNLAQGLAPTGRSVSTIEQRRTLHTLSPWHMFHQSAHRRAQMCNDKKANRIMARQKETIITASVSTSTVSGVCLCLQLSNAAGSHTAQHARVHAQTWPSPAREFRTTSTPLPLVNSITLVTNSAGLRESITMWQPISDRALRLSGLPALPMMVQPMFLAICKAACPTPPRVEWMMTVSSLDRRATCVRKD